MPRGRRPHLKQRKDGRYCKVHKGQQIMGWSEDEVYDKFDEIVSLENEGIRSSLRHTTVFDYASQYLPIHKASVSKNTYASYAGYLNRMTAIIGDKPIRDVTPSDIKMVYNDYIGQSESSIKKAKMLYIDLWDCAIEDGYTKYNPCRSKSAAPHKGTTGTHRALTEEEDVMILSCPADLRLAVLLMRYAGLRRGEVFSFNIDKCVDFERKIITVSEAVRFEGNKGVKVDPKTDAGKREVPLLDILADELKDHHGLICPLKKVSTMTSSAWRSMWDHYIMQLEASLNDCPQRRWYHMTKDWKEAHPDLWQRYLDMKEKDPAKAEEFRMQGWKSVTIRPHDLRHSYCTMLRDNGVDIKLAIKWMGHADEKMILRIYDHPDAAREQRTLKALNESLHINLHMHLHMISV